VARDLKTGDQSDALYYHSAIVICFDNGKADSPAEAVIYTLHGVHAPEVNTLLTANPPVRTLAFLHGLHDVSLLTQQLNLGAHNALEAQRILRSRYWIASHDEIKVGGGIISPFLRRKVYTLLDALGAAGLKGRVPSDDRQVKDDKIEFACVDVSSGENLLLE
jgi:hypothetical protein